MDQRSGSDEVAGPCDTSDGIRTQVVTNQSIDQPIDQPNNQAIDQSIDQAVDQSINQPIPTDDLTNKDHTAIAVDDAKLGASIDRSINDQSTKDRSSFDQSVKPSIDQSIEMSIVTHGHDNTLTKVIEHPIKPTDQSTNQTIDESLLIPILELINQPPYNSSINGLSTSEVQARLARDGFNEFEASKSVPLWLAYFYQIANLLMMLLITSSIIAFGLGEYIEGTAIMVVVVINVNLAVITEQRSESALAALVALSNPTANVVRDGGSIQNVESRLLCVGDIIKLDCGDIVPADCRVVEAHALDINEMILTGESLPVRKHVAPSRADVLHHLTAPNLLLSGTNVQGGRGVAMIVATGSRTRLGEIARLVTENANKPKVVKTGANGETIVEKQPNVFVRAYNKVFSHQPAQTHMQQSIAKLGGYLSLVAIIICVLVLAIGIGRGHKNPEHPDDPIWLGVLLVAVALAVSAVPEGLPLAVTVALSLGGQRLMRQNALVRRIAAVENLGTVNVICTDKTGTLTTGQMSVVAMYVGGEMFATAGAQIRRADEPDPEMLAVPVTNNQSVNRGATPSSKGGFRAFLGLSPKPSTTDAVEGSGKVSTNLSSKGSSIGVEANQPKSQTPSSTARAVPTPTTSLHLQDTLLVSRVATLCSNAKLIVDEEGDVRATGNPTEGAVVLLSDKLGLTPEAALQQNPRVMELPFTSEKKMMFTIHKCIASDQLVQILGKASSTPFKANEQLFLTCGKGSTDMLLPACTHMFSGSGVVPMDENGRTAILSQMDEMADQALRVIACVAKVTNEAPKIHEGSEDDEKDDGNDEMLWVQQKRDLVLLGLLGIADPPRAGVGRAIDIARGGGIKTVMITGDYLATGRAIAQNIHLIGPVPSPTEQVLDCSALRPHGEYLPDAELDALIPNVSVFARAQPRDKLEIVRSLQRQDLVVSMTGDGVNDSPALSQADIGIAMGTGTSVAKGASAIVLLDDQFPTIITAITEGRSIYANIQKFIVFLAATNGISVGFMFLCIIIGLPTPLTPLQILTINIITDGLPALALSAQPAESDVMKARPRNRKDFLITGHLRWLCLGHALWLLILLPIVFIIVLYWGSGKVLQDDILGLVEGDNYGCRVYYSDPPGWSRTFDPDCASESVKRARTAVFTLLAFSENCRPYTVRWLYHPFWYKLSSNLTLCCATAVALACLFIVLFVEPVQGIFGTTYMEWYDWVFIIGCTLMTVIADEIVKYFLYIRNNKEVEQVDEPEPLAVVVPTDAALAHQAAYR